MTTAQFAAYVGRATAGKDIDTKVYILDKAPALTSTEWYPVRVFLHVACYFVAMLMPC